MLKIDIENTEKLTRAISMLSERELYKAIGAAGKRAARHGVTVGSKKLREVYNIKAGIAKRHMMVKADRPIETIIRIEGTPERVQNFRGTQRRKSGIFVSIKKGSGGVIPRSFTKGGVFLMREGADRYPLKGIYGPSVPQMVWENTVLEATTQAAMEMYEKRIIHEIERRAGGAS
jgi:hypothetical protein